MGRGLYTLAHRHPVFVHHHTAAMHQTRSVLSIATGKPPAPASASIFCVCIFLQFGPHGHYWDFTFCLIDFHHQVTNVTTVHRCECAEAPKPTHHSRMQAPTTFFVETRGHAFGVGLAFGRKAKKCTEQVSA